MRDLSHAPPVIERAAASRPLRAGISLTVRDTSDASRCEDVRRLASP
jgi:hypothetical protein